MREAESCFWRAKRAAVEEGREQGEGAGADSWARTNGETVPEVMLEGALARNPANTGETSSVCAEDEEDKGWVWSLLWRCAADAT